jgi:hypothetical protein
VQLLKIGIIFFLSQAFISAGAENSAFVLVNQKFYCSIKENNEERFNILLKTMEVSRNSANSVWKVVIENFRSWPFLAATLDCKVLEFFNPIASYLVSAIKRIAAMMLRNPDFFKAWLQIPKCLVYAKPNLKITSIIFFIATTQILCRKCSGSRRT